MGKKSVLPSLDEVVEKTIKAMEEGKSEIFEIAENSRSEINLIKSKLAAVQKKMQEVIVELDRVERLEKASRVRLMEISRDIKEYTEEDIRKAYLVASNLQAEVSILRNTEKQLYKERTELESQYKSHEDTVHK
ncbi:MAG: histidine kinase, partial [Clostridia bacterium]|nr:histidine kinase [Clostridia bacterium]